MNPRNDETYLAADDRDDAPIVQFNRGEYIQILVDAGIPKDRAEKEADELYRSL